MLYVVGGVFGWVQALRVGRTSKLRMAPFSSGTFPVLRFTTPRSHRTYAPDSAALRSGGAYVHRGSTNRVARIDRFGQVRVKRESRSDWAKVRISTPDRSAVAIERHAELIDKDPINH